ncbi:hypothetical protein RDV89_07725 [Nocardioides zeae]|uniref:DUF3558 domain-containing protein n=1 Tax=Nocardioides imazamoxiresistens TaxID=3231893 RepID=A0ABU3PUP4_9ACTN|nr:hypothetical protein [Nocardioides zeae]MDT9592953.1 hypothetical protein [Nocardioides zeae]
MAAVAALVLGAVTACGGGSGGTDARDDGAALPGTRICDLLPPVARDWEAADPQETLIAQQPFVACAVDPGGLLEVGVRVDGLGWTQPSIAGHLPAYAPDGREPVDGVGDEAYRTLETSESGVLEHLVAREGDVTVLVRNATAYAPEASTLDAAVTEEIATALLDAVTPALLDDVELLGPTGPCPAADDPTVVALVGEVAGARAHATPAAVRCSYQTVDGGTLVVDGIPLPDAEDYLRGEDVDVRGAAGASLDDLGFPALTVAVDDARFLTVVPVPAEGSGASAAEAPDLLVELAERMLAEGILDGLED